MHLGTSDVLRDLRLRHVLEEAQCQYSSLSVGERCDEWAHRFHLEHLVYACVELPSLSATEGYVSSDPEAESVNKTE